MVFEAGAGDLLAVEEIFGADKPDDAVDQQRIESSGDRIGARLHGLLVDAVMRRRRQRAALPRLEIHNVLPERAATERERRLVRLAQHGKIDAEIAVGGLAAGDRLEHQIDRRAPLDRGERGRHMGKHAGLAGKVEPFAQPVEKPGQLDVFVEAVGRRIDADDGIARTQHQPVEDRGGDAFEIVGRMVRLKPRRQPSRQPDGVAKAGDDAAFRGDGDEILQPHDL